MVLTYVFLLVLLVGVLVMPEPVASRSPLRLTAQRPRVPASVRGPFLVAAPAVLAGLAVTPLGLEATFEIFGTAVAALALVVALQAWRTRRGSARPTITA